MAAYPAVGGDGTNNETVNGILQQQAVAPSEVCYALLPVGTGNDWVRSLGIPKRLSHWLEMFLQGHTSLQDVGVADYHLDGAPRQRYFVNVAGMSFDAYVAKFMDENRRFINGRFSYLLALVRCLAKYKLPPTRVHAEGFRVEDFCYTINAGICRYSGGGMQLVPHAVPDDGLLALTVAKRDQIGGAVCDPPFLQRENRPTPEDRSPLGAKYHGRSHSRRPPDRTGSRRRVFGVCARLFFPRGESPEGAETQ
ncbi:MAG: hypothetical protein IPJ00_08195 [Saprospirales bacterium]|nr:hypothetical protein [Saprospirales bacterium]